MTSNNIMQMFDLTKPAPMPAGRSLLDTTCIGVEHELEGVPNPPSVDGWRTETDGSLRNNGIEYVFDGPAGGAVAEARIAEFAKRIDGVGYIINERTSTHVHIDFRDATVRDVARFVAVYCLLEDVLFQMCDKSRIDNPFCVPFRSSQRMLSAMRRMLERGSFDTRSISHELRYGALNLASLQRYGTVEVRMRETVIDPEELIFWCNIFLAIKQFVRSWTDVDPINVVQTMSAAGVDTVMRTILTEDIWSGVCKAVPNAEDMVFTAAQEMQAEFSTWGSSVERKPFFLEDNILLRRAQKTGRYREMLSYAKANRLPELQAQIEQLAGIITPTEEDWYKWYDNLPMFTVSEEGAALYNSSVTTRYPLSAGQVLTRDQLSRKGAVLSRSTVVERAGRVIEQHELLTTESARLFRALR